LVDDGLDEAVLVGDADHAFDFGGQEVGETEAFELSLSVELVDGGEGFFVGGFAVRGVEIVGVDMGGGWCER